MDRYAVIAVSKSGEKERANVNTGSGRYSHPRQPETAKGILLGDDAELEQLVSEVATRQGSVCTKIQIEESPQTQTIGKSIPKQKRVRCSKVFVRKAEVQKST